MATFQTLVRRLVVYHLLKSILHVLSDTGRIEACFGSPCTTIDFCMALVPKPSICGDDIYMVIIIMNYTYLRVVEWVALIRFLFGVCHY